MGLFGGLFGSKKEADSADRCMECGMGGGQHTDWCPEVHEPVRPVGVPAEATEADAGTGDPPTHASEGGGGEA